MVSQLGFVLSLTLARELCAADAGTSFSYQGRLGDSGSPANGRFDLRWALYDSAVDGALVAGPITNNCVSVSNGLFTTMVDTTDTVAYDKPLWIDFAVRTNGPGSFCQLAPRQPLTPAPRAIYAANAGSSVSAGFANIAGTATSVSVQTVPGLANPGDGILLNPGAGPSAPTSMTAVSNITALAALRIGYVTPFDCGAVGDGLVDDTAALQTWLNRACSSNLIACLPPARGAFYKITDALYASNSVTIVGGRGGNHSTSSPYTRCQIRQFTTGKNGLVLTSPNDSVNISGIAIMADPPGNTANLCYGLWFAGGGTDADCSVIEQLLVTGFRVGVLAAGQADTSFRGCSFGWNSDGIIISNIANNVKLESCQLSYNTNYQVIAYGKVIIDNCDVSPQHKWAKGVMNYGSLTFLSSRFENNSTNCPLTQADGYGMICIGTYVGAWDTSVPYYSLSLTNGNAVLIGCSFEPRGPSGNTIFQSGGYSGIYALPPMSVQMGGTTNFSGVFQSGRAGFTGTGPGPRAINPMPGTIEWGFGLGAEGADQALWAYAVAKEAGYGSGVKAFDLLDFARSKQSVAALNSLVVTNSVRFGSPPPSIAVNASGAGAGATASLAAGSSSFSGQLTLTTGTATAADTPLLTLTYPPGVGRDRTGFTVLFPCNKAAAAIADRILVSGNVNSFSIAAGDAAAPWSTVLMWNYVNF
jgi:hypothetical protein